jgi:hypothetical protein
VNSAAPHDAALPETRFPMHVGQRVIPAGRITRVGECKCGADKWSCCCPIIPQRTFDPLIAAEFGSKLRLWRRLPSGCPAAQRCS